MSAEMLTIAALLIPLVGAALIPVFRDAPNARETVTLLTSGVLFAVVLLLLGKVVGGARPEVQLLEMLPGVSLFFKVEPLGMLFAVIASGLWIVNSVYSIGYMRGNDEPRQTPFYLCFALAIFSTLGIAFSGNLITLFLFYELLTLSTYPLVTHKADEAARNGGRIYLLILLGTSMVLLLPAIIWTYVLTGTTDFVPGGILRGKIEPGMVAILLGLFVFGVGKAALMPFHSWLPNAMVAPTPVSALLHAVAVVKAGVFTVLKIVVYVFGADFLTTTGANEWLIYVAGFTIIAASLIAATKDNLKACLAYSTISQLGYVVLGAAFANMHGIVGGGLHILMHAFGKITLFMCAGAIYTALRKTNISDIHGLGRVMPFTFGCFLVGALVATGIPPGAGSWSKLYLLLAGLDGERMLLVIAISLSTLLNFLYLVSIPLKAFFLPTTSGDVQTSGIQEAPLPCLIAMGITVTGCLILFLYPAPAFELLKLLPIGPSGVAS